MGKSIVELRKEVSGLKAAREKENERQELLKERREIKYGKTISAFKRFGGGVKRGLVSVDKALVPQAYAKKKPKVKIKYRYRKPLKKSVKRRRRR